MNDTDKPIRVNLLNQEYQVLCAPHEQEALKKAALFLDKKMREVKNSGKVLNREQIAVMTALNLTNDLLTKTNETQDNTQSIREQILSLADKIDAELGL